MRALLASSASRITSSLVPWQVTSTRSPPGVTGAAAGAAASIAPSAPAAARRQLSTAVRRQRRGPPEIPRTAASASACSSTPHHARTPSIEPCYSAAPPRPLVLVPPHPPPLYAR